MSIIYNIHILTRYIRSSSPDRMTPGSQWPEGCIPCLLWPWPWTKRSCMPALIVQRNRMFPWLPWSADLIYLEWNSSFLPQILKLRICFATINFQNFPQGTQTYYSAKLTRKMHENEENWTERASVRPKYYYVNPPLVRILKNIDRSVRHKDFKAKIVLFL